MDQERTHLLLVKYVAGEATAEELEELEWAFVANPELRRLAGLLSELKQVPPKSVSSEEEQQMLERGWERLKRKNKGGGSPLRALPVVRRIGEGETIVAGEEGQKENGPVTDGEMDKKRPVRFG